MTENALIRPVAVVAAILFLISWAFPIGAGLAKDAFAFPKWWGAADVALAFTLAIIAFAIQTCAHGKVHREAENTTYRVYRTTTHALILVAVDPLGRRVADPSLCSTIEKSLQDLGMAVIRPGGLA